MGLQPLSRAVSRVGHDSNGTPGVAACFVFTRHENLLNACIAGLCTAAVSPASVN